jgi:predicted O-linked N-acetylglucosamine transferase (SPINDLY family)
MKAEGALTDLTGWQLQAHHYLVQEEYSKAATLYEQAIVAEPDTKSHYWHLGLLLLLQGQEAEAQMTWMLSIAEGEPEQIELWTAQLMQVLQTEANRQEELENNSVAWAIRQHMREISPTEINNLLHLLQLALKLEMLTDEEDEQVSAMGVIELLHCEQLDSLDTDQLLKVLQNILEQAYIHPLAMELAEACLAHVPKPLDLLIVLLPATIKIAYTEKRSGLAARFLELYLRLEPENVEVLRHLSGFYQNAGEYARGIELAKLCSSLSKTLPDKIFAQYLVLRGLMTAGGYWQNAYEVFLQQEKHLFSLIEEQPEQIDETTVQRLFNCPYFIPYFRDEPRSNRYIHNQISRLCQINLQAHARELVEKYSQRSVATQTRPLKIGYISHCLRSHSVGWLARWVFKYHNSDNFQLYTYLINYTDKYNDLLQDWYINYGGQVYQGNMNVLEIADKIYTDEIDILIDLDSLTLDTTCEILSLKPAPIQVTWLGWDASGIPSVDYFIADPYVLPEAAQDYYTEKIWRLPQTYIAVDGFEVAVPTIRREQLDIPIDAVVYFSGQGGYKRHPGTARLQMKIIKEVSNSYLLIKGRADEESVKNFFIQIAEEEGVDSDRLRFLPEVGLESIHRANLGIADVVLDTYPYNGATTTLETLWMGIPLVTRVGQQFAARNSYTMMMNVGVTEGIAWTDEEYLEWGVRLGKDPTLRQQISWRLRQSRQTSPLWNAKQFTREIEKAYNGMWANYINTR